MSEALDGILGGEVRTIDRHYEVYVREAIGREASRGSMLWQGTPRATERAADPSYESTYQLRYLMHP